jgi:ketosteroid isomerase-like protein
MTAQTGTALRVALDYYEAWASKNLDRAMAYVAEDIVCDAPPGRIEGAAAYRAFLGPLVEMLISAELLAAFGDQERALIMYDTETTLVRSGPGAECVTVKDGKIVYSRFVFDRVPFAAARAERRG